MLPTAICIVACSPSYPIGYNGYPDNKKPIYAIPSGPDVVVFNHCQKPNMLLFIRALREAVRARPGESSSNRSFFLQETTCSLDRTGWF